MSPKEIEDAINKLTAQGMRVLKEAKVVDSFGDLSAETRDVIPLLIVDVETTGLDASKDKIIEFAGILVECSAATGRLGKVLRVYNEFEDPGEPLPEEIKRITGITDEDLADKKIDDSIVNDMVAQARLCIAHNALLDRGFLEKRFAGFSNKWWACSLAEGPWKELGTNSAKQDYLVFKVANMHYEAHRAINDVAALGHLLNTPGANNKSVIGNILEKTKSLSYQLWVTGAPFDIKDSLKELGYAWCPDDKVVDGEKTAYKSWNKAVFGEEAFEEEKQKLAEIYPGGKIVVDIKNGRSRYSERKIERINVTLDRPSSNKKPAGPKG